MRTRRGFARPFLVGLAAGILASVPIGFTAAAPWIGSDPQPPLQAAPQVTPGPLYSTALEIRGATFGARDGQQLRFVWTRNPRVAARWGLRTAQLRGADLSDLEAGPESGV